MFNFNLKKLADSGSSGSQKPNYKVPVKIMILFQPPFQLFVVSLGDNRVQIGALLLPDRIQAEGEMEAVQKAVDRVNPRVDRINPVMSQKVGSIGAQIGGS